MNFVKNCSCQSRVVGTEVDREVKSARGAIASWCHRRSVIVAVKAKSRGWDCKIGYGVDFFIWAWVWGLRVDDDGLDNVLVTTQQAI